MSIGTLALRGTIGPLFVGHGTQKLFGWFGGHGVEGTAGFFESIGLRPGRRNAIAAGVCEAVGGALLTVGALTPLGATLVSSTMVTAMRKVHLQHGPWATEQGYEYNVVLIAAVTTLVQHGPGSPSIDERFFPNLKGTGWAAASLGAAIAGSYLVDAMSESAPPEPADTTTSPDPAAAVPA